MRSGPKTIHSFLVHPAKGLDEEPAIGGTKVPASGQPYELIASIFDNARNECDVDIVFQPNESGAQQNDCRDALLAYLRKPGLPTGRGIARRLQAVTTHRSGLGLVFVMAGSDKGRSRLVVSRFPADEGILAEERRETLSLAFIERIFMKNAKAYKSVVYEGTSLDKGFWEGSAVDRQVSGPRELSHYWIGDFLMSDLRTTAAAGSKRVAVALVAASRSAPLPVRQELVAATTLLRGRDGQVASAKELVEELGLSEAASLALEDHFPRPELMDEKFRFERAEFDRHVPYRAVALDNGGLIMAEDATFGDAFKREDLDRASGLVRFTTEGHVTDDRLRKTK